MLQPARIMEIRSDKEIVGLQIFWIWWLSMFDIHEFLFLSLLTGLILLALPMLLRSNPSLRVAYIDEVEEREGGKSQKVYYSVLIKAVDNLDQVVSL